MSYLRLKPCAFGAAIGLVWAVGLLTLAWAGMCCDGWGGSMVTMIGSVYVGYKVSWLGGVIGALWGFLDLFIGGIILAWLYNRFVAACAS
jgi:hypothetical protein